MDSVSAGDTSREVGQERGKLDFEEWQIQRERNSDGLVARTREQPTLVQCALRNI